MYNLLTESGFLPKAAILLISAAFVFVWLSYYIYSVKIVTKKAFLPHQITYIIYSCFIVTWILSNLYFQIPLLVAWGERAAINMARFANLASGFAFGSAFLFSCQFVATQKKKTVANWQKVVLFLFTAYAIYVNLIVNLTIDNVTIISPGNFYIQFGSATPFFFNALLILFVLTLYNFTHNRGENIKVNLAKNSYMVTGMLIFMLSTAAIHLAMTFFFDDFSLAWLPPALSISELLFVGYALVTSRFYSSKYIVYKLVMILITAISFALLFSPLTLLVHNYYQWAVIVSLFVIVESNRGYITAVIKRLSALIVYRTNFAPVEQILALEKDFRSSTITGIEKLSHLLKLPEDRVQLVSNGAENSPYLDYFSHPNAILVIDELESALYDTQANSQGHLLSLNEQMRSENTALVMPLFDRNRNLSHLLVSPHKIDGTLFSSEEVRALQDLISKVQGYINADRKVSEAQALANSIAHEMRNPLAQAQLQFEGLRGLVNRDASVREMLYEINKGSAAIERGRQLIDMILSEVNDSSLAKESASPCSIMTAIEHSLNRYGFENNHYRSRIHVSNEHEFVAKINDTLFNFVLFNLLRNSLYYFDSYPDCEIHISMEQHHHENCVVFHDTGPGIDPQIRAKIFDDFFSYSKNGGSGLGLGYCQRVMHAFGGRISCESKVGVFTEFRLYFPSVSPSTVNSDEKKTIDQVERHIAAPESVSSQPARPPSPLNYAEKVILVVDDKEVQRALVKIYLDQIGVKVILANNGAAAVDIFRANQIDLVLMDIQMPKMDGFEASRLIREISPTVPIAALTGESGAKERERIDQLMDARLDKPTSKEALINVINALLCPSKTQPSKNKSSAPIMHN